MVQDRAAVTMKTNRNSYAIHRMVPLPIIFTFFSDP